MIPVRASLDVLRDDAISALDNLLKLLAFLRSNKFTFGDLQEQLILVVQLLYLDGRH